MHAKPISTNITYRRVVRIKVCFYTYYLCSKTVLWVVAIPTKFNYYIRLHIVNSLTRSHIVPVAVAALAPSLAVIAFDSVRFSLPPPSPLPF